MYGPIFYCVSCERRLFHNNVSSIDGLEEKVQEKKPGLFKRCIPWLKPEMKVKIQTKGKKTTENHNICHACKRHLMNGKMPPMCAENGLKIEPIRDESLKLTELERNMIALRILFMKMCLLKKSRWLGLNDRIINVPVNNDDIINTISILPRTPDQAGLVEVNFKRKIEYKNSHIKGQFINTEKLYNMLNHLRTSGNPHYQFFDVNTFRQRLAGKEMNWLSVSVQNEVHDEMIDLDDLLPGIQEDDENMEEREEAEYRKNDPVRKHQADGFDKSIMLADMYPEMNHESDYNAVTIAPGEGKTPKSILYDDEWDIKAFPDLNSPDGKYGLHHKRNVKLTHQNFFIQRVCNKEQKFARTPSYVYAAVGYIEQQQIMRNITMEGKHGREVIGEGGKKKLQLEDAYAVLDNVKQTPRYWKKAKYEMYAKLDNLGPFHIFFTLSCADLRWNEVILTFLRDEGIEIRYDLGGDRQKTREDESADESGDEDRRTEDEGRITVQVKSKYGNKWLSLKKYMEDAEKSRHEYIRENVLTLTRMFNHRVKAFIREIVLSKKNPMCVHKFTYKTEFQNRGAAHVHGVLWLNMNMIESYYQLKSGKLIMENQLRMLEKTNKSTIEVNETMPFSGLKNAFSQIRKGDQLDYDQKEVLARFVDAMTTVSLCPAEVGEDVVQIAREVNEHKHTKTCRKHGGENCRFRFPRFPSERTLIAGPVTPDELAVLKHILDISEKEKEEKVPLEVILRQKSERVLKRVGDILSNEDATKEIQGMFPKGDTIEQYEEYRRLRIEELLKRADVEKDDYYRALQFNSKGYTVVLKRDLDEIWMNPYNPEWLRCWDGNIDVQPCLDFFAINTYITEYFAKDETRTMQAIKAVLENSPDESTKEQMKKVANTFMRSRQIGEAEGFYKLLPDLLLKNSNVSCQWLSLENPAEKVKRMRRADESVTEANDIYKELEGTDGLWKEQPDMVSKWLQRVQKEPGEENNKWADPKDISLAQFAKMYTPSRSVKTKQSDETQNHNKQHDDIYPEAENEEEQLVDENMFELYKQDIVDKDKQVKDPEAKFHLLMWGQQDQRMLNKCLPSVIKIRDPLPDELPFMRKRQYPIVLRFHKSNRNNKPVRFFQGEIMLYHPGWTEEMFQMSDEGVTQLYHDNQDSIASVKKQVMEHLEDVEEARHFVAEANKKLDLEEIAAEMDAGNEQENADLEGQDEQHPEFQHLDPGQEDEPREVSIYRKIDIPDPKVLRETTRGLDPYQRLVVDTAIKYARDLIKAEHPENPGPKPPNLMVHGGAGAGKTTVIKTLVQHVELTLRKSGDESGQPYVIKTAPTGAAASLIEGMTLHKAFNFDFSGKFHSLSDKMRDKKRTELKNLKLVIIDEVSMVKADLFYQLDLRLQEIKEKPRVPFGGVVLMCFGDIMQLRPIMGSYIFQRPKGENFQVTIHPFSFSAHLYHHNSRLCMIWIHCGTCWR